MTVKVLNVSDGNYKVVVKQSGDIDLDTRGPTATGLGKVNIYADLWIYGSQTQVESTQLYISDQKITIADGNSNNILPGDGKGGIDIIRGNGNASFYFNESIKHRNSVYDLINGSFEFLVGSNRAGLYVSSIQVANNDNLYLINQGTGVVTVRGTNNYEENIFNYPDDHTAGGPYVPATGPIGLYANDTAKDALVNTQGLADYVTSALYYTNFTHITNDDTEVRVYDASSSDIFSRNDPSYINFKVDGTQRAKIDSNNLSIPVNTDYLQISSSDTNAVISVTGVTNRNIEIDPSGTGKVKIISNLETTGVLELGNQASNPSTNSNYNVLYSKSALGMGKTGLYFTNPKVSDELVSRRRALGFSMLF
jgi:hypothetical protein